MLSLPNSPSLISYQGQLSSSQFGLVSCSEGDLLGDSRSGEVGKGVDDGEEADHCELRGSGEPSVHAERSGEGQYLQIGAPGKGGVHLGCKAGHVDGAVDAHKRGAVVEALTKGGRSRGRGR